MFITSNNRNVCRASVGSLLASCFVKSILSLTLLSAGSSFADEPLQYNRDIRPILADNCFACHGLDSVSREAGLRLDLRASAIESGALEPGEPEASEMITRVLTSDPDLVMPPPESHKSLTDGQRQMLVRWVAEGAKYQKHWSLIKPAKSDPPSTQDDAWTRNPIDRFVLDRLTRQGLKPAESADSRSLFRRLNFDVVGLPPSIADTEAFVMDVARRGDAAVSDAIDRLMQSTGWGEHRARYWLDAARYGDTHGMHRDNYREIWPYRDWVINSFNDNQPFDKFVIEQLAGDLLPDPTTEQLVATGFQRCNLTTNEGGTILDENLAVYASDRVQTYGWVFLGLTTNCCQCHDHKFDPLTAKDYYSLAAFFRNTTQPAMDTDRKDGGGPFTTVPSTTDRPRWEELGKELDMARRAIEVRKNEKRVTFESWADRVKPNEFTLPDSVSDAVLHLPLNEEAQANAPELANLEWVDDQRFGRAANFHRDSNVELATLGDFSVDEPFSVSTWFRSDNPDNGGSGLVARMDTENKHRGWDVFLAGGRLAMHLINRWPENALKVTTKNAIVENDQWHHVCITYDGTAKPKGIQIYFDGKVQPTTTDMKTLKSNANIHAKTALRVGQRSSADIHVGSMRDVYLFDRELSADDVTALRVREQLAGIAGIPVGERSELEQSLMSDYYYQHCDTECARLSNAMDALESEQEEIRDHSPTTLIQAERTDQQAMAHILMRGDYSAVGEPVTAAPPEALHPFPADAPRNRLGLARWTVDVANPLTPRVTANRFWQEIFGAGLVTTTEDFGVMGSPPSHPELLDWLAVDFVERGWDVKYFFKQILMSSTYRQSANTSEEKLAADRHNSLLSRGPRYRMDAEMIHDNALATSGLLSRQMFGPGTHPYQPDHIWDMVGLGGSNTRNYEMDQGEGLYRRSVYTFWKRMSPPPGLETLNAPNREVCTVRRERTNTPLQALVTLNATEYIEAARKLAEHSINETDGAEETLERIALKVLSRPMRAAEVTVTMANHAAYVEHFSAHPDDAARLLSVGSSAVNKSIEPIEFAAWTMTCNELLNLDETFNK